MKVITLRQPWATLVVIGAKKLETRSRNMHYRGDLLVHASKKMSKAEEKLALSEPFYTHLKHLVELPLGAIIGKVSIDNTFKTELADTFFYENDRFYPEQKAYGWEKIWNKNVALEKSFGDYSPGRYFYELSDPVSFTHHFQVKGSVVLGWELDERICIGCGCTQMDCRHCIQKTGQPCHWVSKNLCSACENSK